MTTVFGFLGLLVCLMQVSAKVVERFPGAPEPEAAPPRERAQGDDRDGDAEVAMVLAIVASQRGEG